MQAGAATAIAEVDAVVAIARTRGTVAMAVTLATLKQAAASLRVAQTSSAVAVVVVAGRAQGLHRVLKAVRPARLRCQISNSEIGGTP